jgi:hypothetical protein
MFFCPQAWVEFSLFKLSKEGVPAEADIQATIGRLDFAADRVTGK